LNVARDRIRSHDERGVERMDVLARLLFYFCQLIPFVSSLVFLLVSVAITSNSNGYETRRLSARGPSFAWRSHKPSYAMTSRPAAAIVPSNLQDR
jgi:hypothetical protein